MTLNILATAASLSDEALLARVQVLAGGERQATCELVAHLTELDTRKILVVRGTGTPEARGGAAQEAPLLPKLGAAHRQGLQADPLVCKRSGGPLTVVAYITNTVPIRRILDHLGLRPPEKPPPDVREVVRVPVDHEGRQIGGQPALTPAPYP